jgi:glycosidase
MGMASVISVASFLSLDYLHDLGVNLLWIGPIFASPMDDNGYDVSDYYSINPKYGTMADLDRLLKEAHLRGIRILLDFPLNHTSDQHPWFQSALKDVSSPEHGYYFIQKGKKSGDKLLPPTNWKGFFATSAWKQIPGTDDFYLHIFSEKMPDVNWANPLLRERILQDREVSISIKESMASGSMRWPTSPRIFRSVIRRESPIWMAVSMIRANSRIGLNFLIIFSS